MSRPFRMLVFIFILNFILMALRVEAVSVVRSHRTDVLIFTVKLISLQTLLKRHPTSEPAPSSTQTRPWWSSIYSETPAPSGTKPWTEKLRDSFNIAQEARTKLTRSRKSRYYIECNAD
jgi:hypothetical protein